MTVQTDGPTRSSWEFTKPPFSSGRSMVAAKVPAAADAGAAMFSRGGNAVDAAVAAAFAAGVAEPYMSGIGGGGFMLIHLAAERRAVSIDYSMIAPQAATSEMFELDPAGGVDAFFGWPKVRDSANMDGYRSIGVPGTVAGLATAVERFGRLTLADVMAPAIELARDGFEVSWFDTLLIAQHQDLLDQFEWTRDTFLPRSRVPVPTPSENPVIRQPRLAETLAVIASAGPGAFYQGPIGSALTDHLRSNGGVLEEEDLRRYRPRVAEDLPPFSYRGSTVVAPQSACGSTTVLETLRILEGFDLPETGHNTFETLDIVAQASRLAFADRYGHLGALTEHDYGWSPLLDDAYIADRRELIRPGAAIPAAPGNPGNAASTGFVPQGPGGSTTHLSAADADGNLVSITQTLLQLFGSGVVAGETGILMNNAMGWFDPIPGNTASVAPGKRPLTNMSPLLVSDSNGPRMALGASGGRKIMQAVTQILMNAQDHGLSMQDSVSAPRIDCSGEDLLANSRLDPAVIEGLRRAGHSVSVVDDSFTARRFASPACIRIDPHDGRRYSGLDPYYPAAAAGE